MDSGLPQIEVKKAEIENVLVSGSTYVKEIEKLSNEYTPILSQIDEETMRWMKLQN